MTQERVEAVLAYPKAFGWAECVSVQEIFGVSARTVRRWNTDGLLGEPILAFGKYLAFRKQNIRLLMQKRKVVRDPQWLAA